MHTLVSNTEDGFGVAANDEVDLPTASLLEKVFFHRVFVRERQIQAFASTKEMRVLCDSIGLKGYESKSHRMKSRFSYLGRRVYNRHKVCEVPT